MTRPRHRPFLGLLHGDPAGIGPELAAKLLNHQECPDADFLLIGDAHVFEMGARQAGVELPLITVVDADRKVDGLPVLDLGTIDPDEVKIAEVTEAGGRSVLRALDKALDLARDGVIDGIVFTPFNKASMHEANLGHEDEIQYMKAYLGVETRVSEFNTMDGMWTARVTSHIPLKDVAEHLNEDVIVEAIRLTDRELRRVGIGRPRIAVAALNPHAGDNGNFGTEEIDIIGPAVDRAAREQLNVDGPWPSDTVFLRWVAKEVDAVVTMYHDQGQIALKLLGFNRGVTIQGGLPFPVGTPAHGTAFDIAGKGIADPGATLAAGNLLATMARSGKGLGADPAHGHGTS